MIPFNLERIGVLMEPEKGNAKEVEGVLNPAVARGPKGDLYIFPRLVAKNNYSRIGIARVKFDENGDPKGVERLGIALEPEAAYEKRPDGGGCEDPRVTYIKAIGCYIMTYTAFGPDGPRIAIAHSTDLHHWERHGLVEYSPFKKINFNHVDNKDANFFPNTLPSPYNYRSIAMLHRPLFEQTRPAEIVKNKKHHEDQRKESIWISYFNLKQGKNTSLHEAHFTSHHCLAHPVYQWENVKIGSGAPPILTKHGWLLVYHGVQKHQNCTEDKPAFTYSAGAMVLAENDPRKILYRSPQPILSPNTTDEKIGTVGNVVFPTGTDRRDDIDQPNRIDVYYGMADNKIGVAKMELPDSLPED